MLQINQGSIMKLLALVLLTLLSVSVVAEPPSVGTKDGVFVDAQREREVPYRIYHPEPLAGRYPVIIVSHGLGDSRAGNGLFGRNLAARGYVCVHLQHAGSDSALFEGLRDRRAIARALLASQRRSTNAVNRFLDVPFAIQELARLNEPDAAFKGHLNLEALGMAGHSYGAISTLVAAGEGVGARSTSYKVAGLRAG